MSVNCMLQNLTTNRYFLRLDQFLCSDLRWSLMYMVTFQPGLPEAAYLEQVATLASGPDAESYAAMVAEAHELAIAHTARIAGMRFVMVAPA